MPPALRALARSRLLQFAVIGGALFALVPGRASSNRISLSAEALSAAQLGRAQREGVAALSAAEAEQVRAEAIEDEVLYREALRLGLDRGDPLLRRHLVQKTLMLAEDLGGGSRTPSQAEVREAYEAHPDEWQKPAAVHLIHVFGRDAQRLTALLPEAQRWTGAGAPPLGDPFPVARDLRASQAQLAARFGEAFAGAVFELPAGRWSGPLRSSEGWHLVKVLERQEGARASFEEVRSRVAMELDRQRRHEAIQRFLQRAYERYQIEVGDQRLTAIPAGQRIAARADSSMED